VLLLFLLSAGGTAFAGSATWNLSPTSGNWETATNWTPATVPNGPDDTATFGVSDTTSVSVSAGDDIEVNGIVFNPGASPFTFTVLSNYSYDQILTISGVGITNNSGIIQNFVTHFEQGNAQGMIQFTNSATAGELTVFTNGNDPQGGGRTNFFDTSSAGSGTFINNGVPCCSFGGATDFFDGATADNATPIANRGTYSGSGMSVR